MRTALKLATVLLAALFAATLVVPAASASEVPHFVTAMGEVHGTTLTVTFVEAGLGNQTAIKIRLTARAWCENHGENYPQAANKQAVIVVDQDVAVVAGVAAGSISGTATFKPDCTRNMDVEWQVPYPLADLTNGIVTYTAFD